MPKKIITSLIIGLFLSIFLAKPAFAATDCTDLGGVCYADIGTCTGTEITTEQCSAYDIPPDLTHICCVPLEQDLIEVNCTGTPSIGSCACPCPETHPTIWDFCDYDPMFTCGVCHCSNIDVPEGCPEGRPLMYCQTDNPANDNDDLTCLDEGACDDGSTRWCCERIEFEPDEEAGATWEPETCTLQGCELGSIPCESIDLIGLQTAIGCLPNDPLELIQKLQMIMVRLGGGIALLFMIVGAFTVLTSQGNPEKVKQGKSVFVGALIGLVVVIFSVFILKFIVEDVLILF